LRSALLPFSLCKDICCNIGSKDVYVKDKAASYFAVFTLPKQTKTKNLALQLVFFSKIISKHPKISIYCKFT
jgi:hypothetical protein